MPKIQEYEPEVSAQGPVGGISPNVEMAGAAGRGLERAASGIADLSGAVQRRQAQKESADVYSALSQTHADYTARLQKETNDGTLDIDQFKQDYEDAVNQVGQNVSTPQAQDLFQRQAARFGGSLLQHAIAGQAQVAADHANAALQTSYNASSDSLYQNPSAFETVKSSMNDFIDSQVADGGRSAKKSEELKVSMANGLAKSAVRGIMQNDPEAAKAALDNGDFDDYIKGDDKYKLYAEVKEFARAKVADQKNAQKLLDDAQDARAEQWKNDVGLPKLVKSALSAKDVLNNQDLSSSEKISWLNMIEKGTREQNEDPAVKNSVLRRLVLPDNDPRKITDITQVEPFVGKGLSLSDVEQMNTWLTKKSPDGQVLTSQRKMLIDYAKQKLVNSNPMMGIKDPEGERNFSVFTNALMQQEKAYKQAGKPLGELYDESKQDSYWNKVPGYVKTPQQIMQGLADQTRQPAPKEDMVDVISPEGVPGKLPKSKLDDYKKKGFRTK